MNQKNFKKSNVIIIVLILISIVSYFILIKRQPAQDNQVSVQTKITYINSQYGFNFSLPLSWKGYSVINSNWQGNMIDNPDQSISGPKILIRHPLWTEANPRQDIPIMIFTKTQWDLIQQEKLSLGAAPIGPTELGQNTNYIFALPARYNYAFLTGFEEVDQIISNKPLQSF